MIGPTNLLPSSYIALVIFIISSSSLLSSSTFHHGSLFCRYSYLIYDFSLVLSVSLIASSIFHHACFYLSSSHCSPPSVYFIFSSLLLLHFSQCLTMLIYPSPSFFIEANYIYSMKLVTFSISILTL